MKKLMLALIAAAAFTGSAVAADLPARAYSKPPAPVAYAPSWTGCYVGGGGGYGLWNQENTFFANGPPRTQITQTTTEGGPVSTFRLHRPRFSLTSGRTRVG